MKEFEKVEADEIEITGNASNTKEKGKKSKLLTTAFAALGHVLLFLLIIILIVVIFLGIYAYIGNKVDGAKNFFENTWDTITSLLSGAKENEALYSKSLPNYIYIDKQVESQSNNESIDNIREKEIDKLSTIIAGIIAPTYYFIDDSNDNFDKSAIFKNVMSDTCILAYAGLKNSSGLSYFQNVSSKNDRLTKDDYQNVQEKLDCPKMSDNPSHSDVDNFSKVSIVGIGMTNRNWPAKQMIIHLI